MLKRFFAWLDERRDIKLARTIKLMQAQNELSARALEALADNTRLMQSWLSGFQRLAEGQSLEPSVVREEDEWKEEKLRQQAKNADALIPPRPDWQLHEQLSLILRDIDGQ